MKLKWMKHLKQAKVKVNLNIWTSPNDNRKISTVFKVVSPEGYNASVEVISYKLSCLIPRTTENLKFKKCIKHSKGTQVIGRSIPPRDFWGGDPESQGANR